MNMKVYTERIEDLENKIDKLEQAIMMHTKLFRNMATKLERFEASQLNDLGIEMKETTPEPTLNRVINLYKINNNERN